MTASETSVRRNYNLGARRAAVSIVALWHLGFDLVSTVGFWEVYRHPWLAGLAWLLYTVIGVVAGVALLAERPVPRGRFGREPRPAYGRPRLACVSACGPTRPGRSPCRRW